MEEGLASSINDAWAQPYHQVMDILMLRTFKQAWDMVTDPNQDDLDMESPTIQAAWDILGELTR